MSDAARRFAHGAAARTSLAPPAAPIASRAGVARRAIPIAARRSVTLLAAPVAARAGVALLATPIATHNSVTLLAMRIACRNGVALLAALLAGCTSVPPARSPAPSAAALEDQMLALVTRARAKHGLAPLQRDSRLTSAARVHTDQMRRKIESRGHASGFRHHGSVGERIREAGYAWSSCGENIAYGKHQTLAQLHAALLGSPGHRANILSRRFADIGIGIEQSGDELWITQEFATPRE